MYLWVHLHLLRFNHNFIELRRKEMSSFLSIINNKLSKCIWPNVKYAQTNNKSYLNYRKGDDLLPPQTVGLHQQDKNYKPSCKYAMKQQKNKRIKVLRLSSSLAFNSSSQETVLCNFLIWIKAFPNISEQQQCLKKSGSK